ncbi:rCG24717, partial [Rattus norvegicus]
MNVFTLRERVQASGRRKRGFCDS